MARFDGPMAAEILAEIARAVETARKKIEMHYADVEAEVKGLRKALDIHRHTDACVDMCVRNSHTDTGCWQCTPDCMDSRKAALRQESSE